MNARIVVLAKAPMAGRSKTRLCPPLTLEQAARVAEAALSDTLAAVAAVPGPPPMLALEGEPGSCLPPGFEVVPQRGGGLDQRIAAAFEDAAGPAVLIGMDTPQVRPAMLAATVRRLTVRGVDAVLGPAEDGGWWALGLRKPDPGAVLGIPMSTPFTGAIQGVRLSELGLRVARLPTLRDVDRIEDALAVAATVPGSRFARSVAAAVRAARRLEPVA